MAIDGSFPWSCRDIKGLKAGFYDTMSLQSANMDRNQAAVVNLVLVLMYLSVAIADGTSLRLYKTFDFYRSVEIVATNQ